MSEWWTYAPSDFLLFAPRTYYRLIELHNLDVWPMQFVALLLGVAILVLARGERAWRRRAVAAILAGCWLWVGWAFHIQRYATINWVAPWFGRRSWSRRRCCSAWGCCTIVSPFDRLATGCVASVSASWSSRWSPSR